VESTEQVDTLTLPGGARRPGFVPDDPWFNSSAALVHSHLGWVAQSMVGARANHWLRSIETYTFLW